MSHMMVRAKIHRAYVTGGNKDYPGSITIGKNMIRAANLLPFELIHVNNVSTGAHWETYVIPGDDYQVVLNGAPAHHFNPGDIVVIMAVSNVLPQDVADFYQTVVYVDKFNAITSVVYNHLKDYIT